MRARRTARRRSRSPRRDSSFRGGTPLEGPAETHCDLQRAGDRVELVAEIDARAGDRNAEADAPQPARVGRRQCGIEDRIARRRVTGVEEADDLKRVAPAERVLQIQQRQRAAALLLELVAVDRTEPADREQPLRWQLTLGPAADRADAEILVRGQRDPRATADQVAREIEVAVE